MKRSQFPDESVAVTVNGGGRIRTGIGGWSYAPWRETFYPADVPQARALEYASRQFSAIEINSTFYRLQTPKIFAKWAAQTPDDFRFAVKAPRAATQLRDLDASAGMIASFFESGLDELGDKLGPLLWQFAPHQKFDSAAMEQFLSHLPAKLGGRQLAHVLDVRHESFACEAFVALARKHGITIAFTDATNVPQIPDITGGCTYLRLRMAKAQVKTGYSVQALKKWKSATMNWSRGDMPEGMTLSGDRQSGASAREVYVFFINGAKERAPLAAKRFGDLLSESDQDP